MDDLFYRAYEDRHRGSRALILSRLRGYLPFLVPLSRMHAPATALDLGCGRGEWLELLGEHGFAATGVDLDMGMLAACRERGLQARQADALAALHALPDGSVALVSAFHVVEHMPFDAVRALIREALRVLQPGGLLILETPNPENLVVGSSSFYQDPSHERPIPPELLHFAVEYAGFCRHRILRLQEAPALRNPQRVTLLDVLNGVSPDYAVVGQKMAPADALSAFDPAFDAEYGVTLALLAQRYDALAEARLSGLQSGQQTMPSLSHMEEKLAQIESRAAQAEARADHLNAHLHAVLHSRSWRIGAPLRFVTGHARRLRAWVREGRAAAEIRARLTSQVRRAGHAALRRPALKKQLMRLLARMPGVEARLRNLLLGTPASAAAVAPNPKPGQLPPRALAIYAELKQLMETRGADAHRH